MPNYNEYYLKHHVRGGINVMGECIGDWTVRQLEDCLRNLKSSRIFYDNGSVERELTEQDIAVVERVLERRNRNRVCDEQREPQCRKVI